ncbi:ABC-type multidrug transport system fused ATPase/permease subunit [Streptomyces glaucescens]
MTSGIRFDSVTVAYDGTVVLAGVDLTVEPGEVMARQDVKATGT